MSDVILRVVIPVTAAGPLDSETLAIVDAAIANQSAAWTAPVYLGQTSGQHGEVWTYETDAVPKTRAVTSDNIAPTLLPARQS